MTLPGAHVEVVAPVGHAIGIVQKETRKPELNHHKSAPGSQFVRVDLIECRIRIPNLLAGQSSELLVKGYEPASIYVGNYSGEDFSEI